jgi:hypothetical protein
MSKDVQPIVFDCESAYEVWKALRDEHESQNLDKVANIRLIYDTLAYIEGTPMRDHINKLKILREQLGAMGDVISPTSPAMRMLRLLPPSWDGVSCQVLRASEPTIIKVKDRLLAEEQSRKTQLAFSNSGNASALAASILRDPSTIHALMSSSQFGSVFLNPNNAALPSNAGRKIMPSTPGSSTTKSNNLPCRSKLRFPDLTCTNPNCGKRGHTIDRCWRKGGSHKGRGPKSVRGQETQPNSDTASNPLPKAKPVDADSTASYAVALVSASHLIGKSSNNMWIPDSGASNHISPYKELFTAYRKFDFP